MTRQLISILSAFACAFGCFAIPAKPDPIKYTQPDGSVITITIMGDEFGHMVFSEDGLLLKEADGWLEYAKFGDDGIPTASGIAALSKGFPESRAQLSQTTDQINAWAQRLNLKKQEKLAKLHNLHLAHSNSSTVTRSEDDWNSNGNISLGFGRFHDRFPVSGEQKVLVILAQYKDVRFRYGTYDYYYRFLNEEGFPDYGSRGSVRDWLVENSSGLYAPDFDLYGPVTLPERREYYGADSTEDIDPNAYMMSVHALQLLDDEVDFSIYDCDGDGKIDNVFIIYAGVGEHDSHIIDAVWPQEWFVSEADDHEYIFDGVALDQYACSSERRNGQTQPSGIGTFLHEFSHVMGLPDLYTELWSFTPGRWSILDQGAYNNECLTPPNYSGFEKGALGWLDFRAFEEGDVELPYLVESGVAYAMPTENENEIFLFENRQQVGNDEFLPGHGMLVWHVDYDEHAWINGFINAFEDHQRVDIIEADGKKTNETQDGDAFPGAAGVTEFGFRTKPKLVSWSGEQLEFDLIDIRESEDGIISFRVVDSKFNTGDPGSVDHTLQDNVVECAPIFDILGRRIQKPGPGQMYIQNGKKHINK